MFRFVSIFASTVFLSIHYGSILYVNSSLLNDFFGPNTVSLLFLAGASSNILLFLLAPKLIKWFGKRSFLFLSLVLAMAGTLFLAFSTTTLTVAISSIIYISLVPMTYYCLDIFLEELSINKRTGEIRGIYLTCVSLGVALGPFLLAILSTMESGLKPVYITATLLLIPPILFAFFSFKSQAPKAHGLYHHSLRLPFGAWWRAKNIRRITLARLVLESFFGLMIIYTPIYLHSKLGFEWSELGLIFTVMLLPFVLLEWPAGELADRLWGEKEIMSVGFIITCVSLVFMPFIGKVFWAWMSILFISRVGASLVEIMTESYFFKHVGAEDTGLLSIFRLTRSAGSILGIAIAVLTINLFSFDKIFFALAIVVFFGLKQSLSLQDTK